MKIITIRIKYIAVICVVAAVAVGIIFTEQKSVKTQSEQIENGVKLPIIMYHSILKDASKSGRYVITPSQLEEDLKYLKENGYSTVFMQEVIDYVDKDADLPQKPIVLTFDDGNYNNLTYLLPILEKYDMRALISIVGSYTDLYTKNPDENPNYAYLSWENVNYLTASGRIEIGNHSYDMHSTGKRMGTHKIKGETSEHYRQSILEDVGKMQEKCEENMGYAPSVFTYPFGSISLESTDVLKEMGFSATLSCGEGINVLSKNHEELYLMKRCIRTNCRSVRDILENA